MYCQKCGHEVKLTDTSCTFCGTLASLMNTETKECKQCQKQIPVNANYCIYCGHDQAQLKWQSKPQQDIEDKQQMQTNTTQDWFSDFQDEQKELKQLFTQYKPKSIENLPKNESRKPGLITSTKLMLRDWLTINKRMGLGDFWWGYAGLWCLTILFSVCLGAIVYLLPSNINQDLVLRVVVFLGMCWALLFYFINFTALIRRYHDAELPAILCVLMFVPFLGELVSLLLAMRPQKNEFGWYSFEDPFKRRR